MFFPFFFVFFHFRSFLFVFQLKTLSTFLARSARSSMLAFTISLCTALSSHNAQKMSNRVIGSTEKTSSIYPFSPRSRRPTLLLSNGLPCGNSSGFSSASSPHNQISCPSQSPIVNVSFTISFSPSFSFSAINRHINSINFEQSSGKSSPLSTRPRGIPVTAATR